MIAVHTDPLVDDYLRRLEAAASGLPPDRRLELVSEIRGHLREALGQIPKGDEAGVRNVLDRLGAPEEVAAAALDTPADLGSVAAGETSGLAIMSLLMAVLWFAGIGAVVALVLGHRARKEIRDSAGRKTGSGLATAGIVLGWIGIVILVAGVILIAVHPAKTH
jgi:hypothetical protein